jgi:hypothetical protein
VLRIVCFHSSGTGGCCQFFGSELSEDWVGTTSVPVSPRTSRKARTTASAPPFTQPSELREEWTRRTSPVPRPSERRLSAKDLRVQSGPDGKLSGIVASPTSSKSEVCGTNSLDKSGRTIFLSLNTGVAKCRDRSLKATSSAVAL